MLTNRELAWTNQTNQTIKQQKEKVILCGYEPFDNFDHLDHLDLFGHLARAFVFNLEFKVSSHQSLVFFKRFKRHFFLDTSAVEMIDEV